MLREILVLIKGYWTKNSSLVVIVRQGLTVLKEIVSNVLLFVHACVNYIM